MRNGGDEFLIEIKLFMNPAGNTIFAE
jgi:hypothetical protein